MVVSCYILVNSSIAIMTNIKLYVLSMYSIVILLSKYVFCPQIWKIISFVRNCSERQKRVQHVIHSVVCSKRKTTVTSQLLVQKLQCNLHITCMQFTEHKPGSEAMLYSKENGNIYVTACLSADSNCFRAIFHLALCWLDSLGPHSVWAVGTNQGQQPPW